MWPLARIWVETVRSYRNISAVRWLTLGVGVGLLAGIAATLFFLGIEYFKHLFVGQIAGIDSPLPEGEDLFAAHPGKYRPWMIPILTCSVGLLTGFLVSRFIPETKDSGTDGTDAMIKSFHRQGGVIRPLVPIIKGVTSILTISTGGSAGREGPISQIGAGIGSWLSQRLGLSARERRILLLAGAAGGLGAIFRAPLGGALTAIEVIYLEDFEAEAVLPAVLSSVVAYTMFTVFFGTEPIFGIPEFIFTRAQELPFYIVLALFCAFTGQFYVKTFFFLKTKVFLPLREKIGITLTTGIGGLGMGLLGMAFPQVLSGGYGWLEHAILGNLELTLIFMIIIGKTIATSLTLGSGMSGGMFAPALFVGGMSGGVVGYIGNMLYPTIVTQPGGYVLVGMAAFFAGVANAPIGPLLMVCELTQGYGLLAPLMLSSALCLVLNRKISLYEYQVDNKFDSPAHASDKTTNVLEMLQVRDFYRPENLITLKERTSLKELTDILAVTNDFNFPVLNDEEKFTGVLSMHDVRQVLFEDGLYDVIRVKDICRPPAYVRLDYDLYSALLEFVDTDLGQIPVLDSENNVIGILNREDVFTAYSDAMKALKEEAE
ncbi:MAG: chloride channel protein [Desulfovibrio sp.]|nr:MAG: chloride channel protein [Desulfovibrio sp.]